MTRRYTNPRLPYLTLPLSVSVSMFLQLYLTRAVRISFSSFFQVLFGHPLPV